LSVTVGTCNNEVVPTGAAWTLLQGSFHVTES
jgi:hypothetical protein